MWTIFKVFIEFVTILLLLYVLVFLPPGMWDLSTPTRDQTWTPCIGSWSPNHWTTRHYCFLTTAPGLTSPPFSDQQLFESALCNSVEVKEAEWSLLNTGKFCTWDSHIRSCFVPFLSLKNQNFFFFFKCSYFLLLFTVQTLESWLFATVCCGLQHTRLPCPSLSPRVCSNSYALSQWYCPTISSSVAPFSSCPQSFPASGYFLVILYGGVEPMSLVSPALAGGFLYHNPLQCWSENGGEVRPGAVVSKQ